MKLNLFSDHSYLLEGQEHDSLLYPFWGEPPEKPDSPRNASWTGTFNNFLKQASSYFAMSSLEDADLVIIPANLEAIFNPDFQALTEKLIDQARAAGKPAVGFFYGDLSHLELPIQCDLIFRNSLYRSRRKASDFVYPAWSVDFTHKYFNGELPIRAKSDKPVVGFCGFAGKKDLKLYAKQFVHQLNQIFKSKTEIPSHFVGQLIRRKALIELSKSSLLKTNFIFRDAMGLFSQPLEKREDFRKVYGRNMAESDYILCCRGYGNYSFRFCEIFSSGKIPIFINTDCVLPYDFEIDWKKYCVWLDESEIPMIAERVAEFHDRLSAKDFIDLQHECRRIWQERLSPEGFYSNLYRHLDQI